jgi:hypothetical protein
MTPAKLRVAFARFPYAGNGMSQSEHPDVGDWLSDVVQVAKADKRIETVLKFREADTPITMTRNGAVKKARELEIDVLVMLDSDMQPDMYLGKYHAAKAFWETSFDFLYENWMAKRYIVIGAPYCGGGERQVPFAFRWRQDNLRDNEFSGHLELYTREECVEWQGIAPISALATGVIMCAMPVFELTEPKKIDDAYLQTLIQAYQQNRISHITFAEAMQVRGWFYYEFTDNYCTEKASTEDVTFTRDISLKGIKEWGYNPLYINWDAWAGHHKSELVGKPQLLTPESVSTMLVTAAERMPITIKNQRLNHIGPPIPDSVAYRRTSNANGAATDEERELAEACNRALERAVETRHGDDTPAPPPEMQEQVETEPERVLAEPAQDVPAPAQQEVRRVENDKMGTPPISEQLCHGLAVIAADQLNRCQRPIKVFVLGHFTASIAASIASTFGPEGSQVLCCGDAVTADGHMVHEWLEQVSQLVTAKRVIAAKGPIEDVLDMWPGELDMIVVSQCGTTTDMGKLFSKCVGKLSPHGLLCGTTYDEAQYPASVQALQRMFDGDVQHADPLSLWLVDFDRQPVDAA